MTSRRSRLNAFALGFLGLLLGLAIVAGVSAPRVTGFSPMAETGDVSATTRIAITFTRPMDRASVRSHLTIDPQVAGTYAWEDNTLAFRPSVHWPQGAQVEVRLLSGARSARGLPLLTDQEWTFTVGAPRVVYLWPAQGPADLYARTVDQAETTRLTETDHGVYDYTVSGDGSILVYSSQRLDGGTDLRRLDLASGEDRLLYACPQGSRCRAPALTANGDRLAFEQFELRQGGAGEWLSGPTRVWMVDGAAGQAADPIGPEDHITASPSWSPQGWLAYYDSTLKAISVIDPAADESGAALGFLANELGDIGSWSPDGRYLLFPEIIFPAEADSGEGQIAFYSHLFRTDLVTGARVDLSAVRAGMVEDASPAYSPDGVWVAFARRSLDPGRWTLGRQVWVMRQDGTGLRNLTAEPSFNHSALSWSPDSTWLVYMRFNQSDLTQSAEIWVIQADGENAHRLAQGGYLPRWIP
jgi:Tol biopolymer transport system component